MTKTDMIDQSIRIDQPMSDINVSIASKENIV